MPINAQDIIAVPASAAPAPAPEPVTPVDEAPAPNSKPKDGESALPDELLKEVPALQLLLHGSPPATFAPKDAEYPELKVVAKHLKDLGKAGFGVYPTKDKANVVVFNGLYVTPEQVKAADEGGTLDKLAVPYDELRGALGAQGGGASPPDASAAPESAPAAPMAAESAPENPAVEKKLTTARVNNLSLGAPTSGPLPGQGRILNNLTKPVI